ncbi:MAG: cytochrome P460 family protein [Proteobacteria bacterium]|nr:cytochrome P460 family protein [Pseudomonadota bacterium]
MTVRSKAALAVALGTLVPGAFALSGTAYSSPEHPSAARYTARGELIFPADYREWVFLTSGVNMNYSDEAMGMDHDMVDNVFVDPQSWRAFKQTGKWPDGTVLVKEPRMGAHTGSINKSGTFQTEQRFSLEVHVKDSRRFKGGWAFFVHRGEQPASAIPGTAACYSCHGSHGAVDTTFVQFYPTAKPIAVKAGTFDAAK